MLQMRIDQPDEDEKELSNERFMKLNRIMKTKINNTRNSLKGKEKDGRPGTSEHQKITENSI